MKLDRLTVHSFKNLSDLSVDFDEGQLTTVVVGKNGTGKSNLIEALIRIFRNLDLDETPPFGYEIEYFCRGHRIIVDADPSRPRDRVNVTVDGKHIPYSRFSSERAKYLPTHVFGYYSGTSNRMETHFETHQERFYQDLKAGKDQPLRPLFYARLVHSQFVLLAFFNEQDQYILDFLREYLSIEDLGHILFVMREPPWKSKTGDARFWNARGTVRKFLNILYDSALAPLRLEVRVPLGFRKSTTKEHLYLYVENKESLRQIASNYENQGEFFKALESTYISELISEVRTRVKVKDVGGDLTFRDLSEGEQQLLMVLGLLRFTQEEESLFLLDEPDTHLNPAWGIQYLELLHKVVGKASASHIIMATHNPLVVASLERSQVLIMRHEEKTNVIRAEKPEEDPRGMGIAGLLTSDVYGLRSQLDPPTLKLLDEKRDLAIQDELTDEQMEQLAHLNRQLAELSFTESDLDPMYQAFVSAMTSVEREEGLRNPVLTEEQRSRRKDLAEEIVQRLRSEQQEGP